jgi:predicted PurR-regulated permease PerM
VSDSGPQPPAAHSRAFSGSNVRAVLVGLAGGAGLFLAWLAANTLFLIFAGLLFPALLDACTRGLSTALPLGRGWNLAIVCFGFAVAIFGVLFWSGYSISSQIDQLIQALNQGLGFLEGKMADLGLAPAAATGRNASVGDLFRFLLDCAAGPGRA